MTAAGVQTPDDFGAGCARLRATRVAIMLIRLLTALTLMTGAAQAQATRTPSHCIAVAGDIDGAAFVHKASYDVDVPSETVLIHYIDHASFLIRSHGGLNIVTDFTGYIGNVPMIPDVVTDRLSRPGHFPRPERLGAVRAGDRASCRSG